MTSLVLAGALALCSPRFVLPRGAAVYAEMQAHAPQPISQLTLHFVSMTGHDYTSAGYSSSCRAGVCADDWTASAEGYSESRYVRRVLVLIDPAEAQLEATITLHVDGVAYDVGPLASCQVPRAMQLCPAT